MRRIAPKQLTEYSERMVKWEAVEKVRQGNGQRPFVTCQEIVSAEEFAMRVKGDGLIRVVKNTFTFLLLFAS